MAFLLLFLIVFFITITIRRFFKRKIEEIFPITVVLIIIIIYLAGLYDNLKFGVKVVEFLTLVSFIYNIFYFFILIKNKKIKEELKQIFTPGFLIYIILYIICIYINKNRPLEDYDEFNHWALIIKNMFFYNGYGTLPNSKVTFNEYPPFTGTFAFLLLSLKGKYMEGYTLIAQNLLYLSFIIFITNKIEFSFKFENIKKIFLSIVFIIATPIAFYTNFFSNLLVDGLLGILFGIGLYVIYENNNDNNYKNIFLISVIISLFLIKTSGILFSVILTILYLIKKLMEKDFKNFKAFLCLMTIPLLLVSSWYIKVNISKQGTEWNFNNAINRNFNINTKDNITEEYFRAFTQKNDITSKELSFITVILILIIYSYYIYNNCSKKEKKNYIYIIIGHTLAIIIFMYGLWVTFTTLFTDYEASILACWWRYTATILISWTVLNNFIICNKKNNKLFPTTIIVLVFLIFMPFKVLYAKYIEVDKNIADIEFERNKYKSIIEYKDTINKKDKIYFVSKLMTPFILKVNKYEFIDYNIANKEADLEYNILEFADILRKEKYKYVYIYKIFYDFESIYYSLFEDGVITENTLYEVIVMDKKNVKLREVKKKKEDSN